jgi:hypothetical protein
MDSTLHAVGRPSGASRLPSLALRATTVVSSSAVEASPG